MRNTDIVIANQGIRPLGSADERSVGKARMYIQSNYIKKELANEFDTNLKVMAVHREIPKIPLMGSDDFIKRVKDKVDYITSSERIEKIHNHVFEMEYVDALKEIFK